MVEFCLLDSEILIIVIYNFVNNVFTCSLVFYNYIINEIVNTINNIRYVKLKFHRY